MKKENDKGLILSITDGGMDKGLEVRLNDSAYGNLAIVGLLEKIKQTLLSDTEPIENSNLLLDKKNTYEA